MRKNKIKGIPFQTVCMKGCGNMHVENIGQQ